MPAPVTQYAQISDFDVAGVNAPALVAFTTAQKNAALVNASRLLDGYFRSQFTLPFTQVGGDLGEGVIQDDEVVGSGIRTGIAASEQSRDWFASAAVTVVAEHQQRMEPERLLPRLGRVLLL